MKNLDFSDMIGQPFDEDENCCYDVVRKAYAKFDILIPKTNIATCVCKEVSTKEIQKHIMASWEKIDKPEMPCGIVIKQTDPRYADHLAVCVAYGKMIHVRMGMNTIIESIYLWKPKIIGYYKYVGNNN